MKIIYKPMGSGVESLRDDVDLNAATLIMPNRKWIARSKEALAAGVGFLGVNFFTFDDLMAELAMERPRNQRRAAYAFREALGEGDTAFAPVRDMEKIRRLFQWCDDVNYLGVEEEELPYSWRKDKEALLAAYRDAVRDADCVTNAAVFAEAMAAEVSPERTYIVVGFSHYKERHRLLLKKLDAAAHVVAVTPFGEKKEANDIFLFQTVDGERALRHMAGEIAMSLAENPRLKIGVVMNEEGDRAAMKAHLASAGIPAAGYSYTMGDEALCQLRLLWRRGEDVASACAFLRSPLANMEDGKALAAALELLPAKDLAEIFEKPLPYYLRDEKKALLLKYKELLRGWRREKEGGWEDFARLSTEAAEFFGEEAQKNLADALADGAGDYGRISGREFESILCAHLEKEGTYGVDILSLDEAYGGEYDRLFVSSLDGNFMPTKIEDSLMNRSVARAAMDVGLYPDFFQEEEVTDRLSYLLASSKKSYLYKVGDGEEATIFSALKEDFYAEDLDKAREAREEMWELATEEEDFSPEAAMVLADWLRQKGLSPSAVDAYLRCPFRYYAERVLKTAPEEEDGRPVMAKGTIYHEALARYFSGSLSKEDLPGFVAAAYDEKMSYLRPEYLWAWEKKDMVRALLAAIQAEEERLADEKRNAGFRPTAFETDFTYPFKDVAIHGVIDRVDRNESGDEILIDYKSGGVPKYDKVAAYEVMQLSLYALARRSMGNRPASLEYVSVEGAKASVMVRDTTRAGNYSRLGKEKKYDGEAFDGFLNEAENALGRVIASIKKGAFPAEPTEEDACKYCPYGDLCRKEAADVIG